MTSIIIISGAGQLGSRYLQGLATCTRPLDIHVHDIDDASLTRAKQRWDEVATTACSHTVTLHTGLETIPVLIDVAIIATTARWRPDVVTGIAVHANVDAWILEKVLAQSDAGLNAIEQHVGSVNAWVNTPRRMLPWHQALKSRLDTGKPMQLKVSGGAWGLACNSIHFLDMFAWWTGEAMESLDTSALDSAWVKSKRPGNWEVMGTLTARFSGGSVATLSAQEGEVFYKFELEDGARTWLIDEAAGNATRSDGLALPGRLPFQSEVSGALVESILVSGTCKLPTLSESLAIHRPFISSLLSHWRATVDAQAYAIPIT